MNPQFKDGAKHADVPLKMIPACLHLRHKLMYCDDQHMVIGMVNDESTTRVFFCSQTGDSLGPDDRSVGSKLCCNSRGCYRAAPGALPVPTMPPSSEGAGSMA